MKKSQVKFGETFAVIIVVYLIILIGSVWYNGINKDQLEELNEKNQMNLAFEKYRFLSNLDVLMVSQKGRVGQSFDYHALKSFYNFSQSESVDYLQRNLGEAYIHIYLYNFSVYSQDPENAISYENFTLYNYTFDTRSSNEVFWSIISVENQVEDKTSIGVLKMEFPFN